MLSYAENSRDRPYEGNHSIFTVYDGGNPVILKAIMLNYVWSPIIWSGCKRKQVNFYKSELCALDFDHPTTPLAGALRNFCDMWHIIGLTRNHQLEKKGIACDRYRVLLRWNRPIVRFDEYVHSMEIHIDDQDADVSGKDGARCFFPCTEIVSTNFSDEAYPIDVVPVPPKRVYTPEEIASMEASALAKKRQGIMPRRINEFLTIGPKPGGRNDACYKFGCECRRAGYNIEETHDLLLASPAFGSTKEDVSEFIRAARNGWKQENSRRLGNTKAT